VIRLGRLFKYSRFDKNKGRIELVVDVLPSDIVTNDKGFSRVTNAWFIIKVRDDKGELQINLPESEALLLAMRVLAYIQSNTITYHDKEGELSLMISSKYKSGGGRD